ncbi:MAG: ribonuclease P protein component [Polaromonas sp.]
MQRLKTRAQFQAVMAGALIAKTHHFALHRKVLGIKTVSADRVVPEAVSLFRGSDAWIGAMVPKRWAKRAVTRNAIKRQIYNVSAGFSHQYSQAAFVVRLRSSFSAKEFVSATSEQLKQSVRIEVQALMQAGASAS